jgi:hypothetical protein
MCFVVAQYDDDFRLCTYLGHEWVYSEFNDLFDCPMQSIEALGVTSMKQLSTISKLESFF